MVDLNDLITPGRKFGRGGARIRTAVQQTGDEAGIRAVILDIIADLDAANTEGAFGVTLRVTNARLNKVTGRETDYGHGGSALQTGGPNGLRQLMGDFALDIADIDTAGSGFAITHTAAKISADFVSGGKHMHENPSDVNDGKTVGPDGTYDWVVQAFHAIATDIAALKAADSLNFVPATIPIT